MTTRPIAAAIVCALFAALAPPLASAKQLSIPDYFIDQAKLPFDALPGTTTTRLWGVHKNAGYRVEVPANWNGELVVYAHGYRGDGPELTVSNPSIRRYLIHHGYAWAASSYSKNRYDVRAGVQDTHAVTTLFNGLVGKPRRTYLMGHSMGGHITGSAIEQFPRAYDGALPMCGVMGDVELFDFFLSYSLIAQAAAGIDATYPDPDFQTAVRPDLVDALGPSYPFVLNDAGRTVKQAVEYLTGGERPTFDVAFVSWADFLLQFGDDDGTLAGLLPGNVSTNKGLFYQLDGDPAHSAEEVALNQSVLRVAADPQARRSQGLANVPKITGDIPVPVISMHTIGDLFVPFSMEQIYAREVAAHGKGDMLVSRAIRDVGHCAFTTEEQEQAFADLVKWVETGAHPAGDDILDPATVARPDFGCQFTSEDRGFLPPCP